MRPSAGLGQALDPQLRGPHLVNLPVDPARESEKRQQAEHDQDPPVRPHPLSDLDQHQPDDHDLLAGGYGKTAGQGDLPVAVSRP